MRHTRRFVSTGPASLFLLLAATALLACGGGDGPSSPAGGDPDDDPPPSGATTGTIQATVTADGAPRGGVTVRLLTAASGAVRATQTTGASGTTVFAALPVAAYDVQVTAPTGFSLANGEADTRRVTVSANAQATVTFALQAATGGNVRVIDIQGFTFSPADVTVARGTTVRWVNPSSTLHTVTPDGHSEWQSATLASSGSSFSHTFDTAGTYNYFCQPHQGLGMTGVIRVQ